MAGVIAHELAHIQNRDTLIMTITATIAGAISTIANLAMFANIFGGGHSSSNEEGENNNMNPLVMVLVSMLAPIAASVVQMTISRTREYEADKIGAKICGNPMALANALAKIEQSVRGYGIHNEPAENNQAMAHLFIINPLFGKKSDSLFSTHPDTQNRIAALQELARSGDFTNKSYSENRQSALRSSGDVHEKKSPWE